MCNMFAVHGISLYNLCLSYKAPGIPIHCWLLNPSTNTLLAAPATAATRTTALVFLPIVKLLVMF